VNIRTKLVLLTIITTFLFQSCKKEPSELGLDITPAGDQLNFEYCDTLTIDARTILDDSIRTDETSPVILGSFYDPEFGKTTASIYTQLRLKSTDISFGENPTLDSIVLKLQYDGIYGETNTPQHFTVYELSGNLIKDTAYYSNQTKPHYDQAIGNVTFFPHPYDSVKIDTINYAPHLRIRLSDEFGNKFIHAADSIFLNNEAFLRFLKGICIFSDPVNTIGKGAMLYFNLLNPQSEMVLYYQNDSANSLKQNFVINQYAAFFTHFDHYGYAHASNELKAQLAGDSVAAQRKLYLQSMGGTKVKFRIPYLLQLAKSGKIVINQAELVVKADMPTFGGSKYLSAPPSLTLRKNLNDTSMSVLIDETEGSGYFGGTLNNKNEYRFRITRYVQSMFEEDAEPNQELFLFTRNKAYRVMINGRTTPVDRLRLQIFYTHLKN